MVEGPGCTRNGQKVSSLLHHQVLKVECTTATDPKLDNNKQHQNIVGKYLLENIVIGKELFLIFGVADDSSRSDDDDVALRLHFGMNGSTHISSTSTTHATYSATTTTHGKKVNWREHNLTISFERKETDLMGSSTIITLKAYQTTITGLIAAHIPRRKYANLSTLDVCSPTFQYQDVLQKIKRQEHQNRPISDVLLDQRVFPGVGNVIKVEALHDARIHPKNIVSTLTEEQIMDAIISCRKYAMSWFKTGRAPPKCVYNQVYCGSCGQNSISIQRVGGQAGSLARTTFWCTTCQPLYKPAAGPVVIEGSTSETAINLLDDEEDTNTHTDAYTETNAPCPSQLENNHHATNHVHNAAGQDKERQEGVLLHRPKRLVQCPLHGESLVLKRVKNPSSVNISRLFYTCTHSKCSHFAWADLKFPYCKCQKRCALRISKTEKSGGKWFFSCRSTSEKVIGRKGYKTHQSGCGHFQWATEEQLLRLGSALTPLL